MTLIDKAEALLPCPFCGGEAELWNAHDNRPAWIACMGRCAVLVSKEHTTDAEAIAAWNRRAALPARVVGVKPPLSIRDWVAPDHDYRPSMDPDDQGDCAECGNSASWHNPPALAPTDAAHVNETPKSEHDAQDVLTAAQAPAEDAHAKGETEGQMLERLGMDGAKWAAEFRTTALRLGYSDMDEGWLIGWFCNAIMAGYDRAPTDAAQAREAALREAANHISELLAPKRDENADYNTGVSVAYDAILALIGERT